MSLAIPSDCADKLFQFGENVDGRSMVDLFNAAANDARMQQLPASTLVITMYDENSAMQPGDYAAELHIVVRKVAPNDGNDSGSEV